MVDKISYRIDYTKVDEDLNNFPVCVWITTDTVPVDMFNSFFTMDTFKPTRFKVVNPLTDLELYTEISYYDYNNKEMELYVKIPIIYHDKYTYLDIVPISSGTSMYVCTTDGYVVDTTISGDEFIGNDNDLPNSYLWFNVNTETPFKIKNNKITNVFFGNAVLNSFFKLSGDFEIEVSFDWVNFSSSYNWTPGISLYFEGTNDRVELVDGAFNNDHIWAFNKYVDGSWSWAGNIIVNETTGIISKITRVGGTLTAKRWNGTSWHHTEILSDSTLALDAVVCLQSNKNTGCISEFFFSKFVINGGTIKMYPSQQVWDSNFKAVYHMSQDPSTGGACILDSTSNANHGTPYGNMTSDDLVEGPVGKALDFDGVNDYVSLPSSLTGVPSEPITFLYWVKTSDSSQGLLSEDEVDGKHIDLNVDGGVNHNTFRIFFDDGVNTAGITGTKVINDNVWHLLGFTRNEYNWTIWVDGTADGTITANDVGDVFGDSQPIYLMHRPEPYFINGSVDQVQINNVIRSAAWIKTTYSSLKNELIMPVYPTNCIGTVKKGNNIVLEGVKINLHRRIDGALVGTTTTTMSGTFCIGSPYVEDHYIVALSNDDNFNALIYDYINPTYSGGI